MAGLLTPLQGNISKQCKTDGQKYLDQLNMVGANYDLNLFIFIFLIKSYTLNKYKIKLKNPS